MTCIVGIAENGQVWLGGDSFGGHEYHKQTTKNPKVFPVAVKIMGKQDTPQPMLIGVCGSFRIMNILEHGLEELLIHDDEMDIREWMTEFFAEKVRELFKNRGVTQMLNDTEEAHSAEFLIGFKGQLFTLQGDFAVIDWHDDVHAIGAGEEFALGSLHTSAGRVKSPVKRIELALAAAATYSPLVSPPFTVIATR